MTNLRITSPHVKPTTIFADSKIVEEAGGDDGHLVLDALHVQRLLEVDLDRTRPFLVFPVAQLTEKTASEYPNVTDICKNLRNKKALI